jgi:hypothetical protein
MGNGREKISLLHPMLREDEATLLAGTVATQRRDAVRRQRPTASTQSEWRNSGRGVVSAALSGACGEGFDGGLGLVTQPAALFLWGQPN